MSGGVGANRVEPIRHQVLHAPLDLVADRPHLGDRKTRHIGEVPILDRRRHIGAGVSASHRHRPIGMQLHLGKQLARLAIGEVDSDLGHRLGRSGARSQAEASRRRALLRAHRLSRCRARRGRTDGERRQSARRSDPAAADRRAAKARRQGLRMRAGSPLPTTTSFRQPSMSSLAGSPERLRDLPPLKRHFARRVWKHLVNLEREISMTTADTQRGKLTPQIAVAA